jgi:uncharacterized membrane protein
MTIAFLVVAVLAALALTRLPAAIRGRNPLVVASAFAIALAFALITPEVYRAVDGVLPFENAADLLAKLLLFTGLLLAGTQVARAYDAPRTLRFVSGLPGALVFVGVFVVEVALFVAAEPTGRAADLALDLDQGVVRLYSTVATAYPAYLFALLLPHVVRGVRSSQTSARVTSLLLTAGGVLAIVRFVIGLVTLGVPAAYPVGQVVSGLAAVLVALGLAVAFFARMLRSRAAR